MIKVNVFADNKNRKHKIKNPSLYIKKKIQRLKKYYFFKNKNIEFSILLTGNDVIKKLNKRFRNKNKITDVLSFPFFEKGTLKKMIRARNNIYLGDVVINLNKINSGPTNDILLEFAYSNQIYLDKIDIILGSKNSIKKIFVVQKHF